MYKSNIYHSIYYSIIGDIIGYDNFKINDRFEIY